MLDRIIIPKWILRNNYFVCAIAIFQSLEEQCNLSSVWWILRRFQKTRKWRSRPLAESSTDHRISPSLRALKRIQFYREKIFGNEFLDQWSTFNWNSIG